MTDTSSPPQSTMPAPPRTRPGMLRWLRRLSVVSWAGWALAILSLWLQHRLGVYHTIVWLWLPVAFAGGVAGGAAFLLSLWGRAVGLNRRGTAPWGMIGLVPLFLWAALAAYMFHTNSRRLGPNTHPYNVGAMAAVSLMEWHAALSYPYRVRTDRLVMYYDDGVTEPAADVAAMEAHLARLEELLGRRQHSRIHWVRGPV